MKRLRPAVTGSEPTVVARLPIGRAVGWSPVPHPLRDRRLQPRMPGDRGRHFAVGTPRRPRTGPDRRDAWLALHGGQRQWRCLEMSMATSKVEALVSVAVIAGLLSGVVLQNHC